MNTYPLKPGMIVNDALSSMRREVSSDVRLVCTRTDFNYPSHTIGESTGVNQEEWESIDIKRWRIEYPKEELFDKLYLILKS